MRSQYKNRAGLLVAMALSGFLCVPATVSPAAPPNDGGLSKGTAQLAGGAGVFGVTYTMHHGENLTLLKAKYTIEPHNDYNGTMPKQDEKIFWLTFAVKNPQPNGDLGIGSVDMTLVDEDANNYPEGSGQLKIAKSGSKEIFLSLKPGQGIGQDPLTNELSLAWVVPGNAKIVKIMVNEGRATSPGEKVLRYNIAGFPGGSPKNIVAPLPKYAADPTDPSGATASTVSPAVLAKFYPSGFFSLRADSVAISTTATLHGKPPADGKEFVILQVTAKNDYYHKERSTFDIGDEKNPVLKDADGEKYTASGGRQKISTDANAGSVELEPGESTTFRYVFEVPKSDKLTTLNFGGGAYGHIYQLDVSGVQ